MDRRSPARDSGLALVGESGSGKSTAARLILRLIDATAGAVAFDGVDVLAAGRRDLRTRRRRMQIVFQDPYASLDPAHRVDAALMEPFAIHGVGTRKERHARVAALLERVGLEPSLVVCDEPVSALDVSIQAQVLNLLGRLQKDLGLTYLFISHDMSVVRHIADHVAVMYLGQIVELAERDAFFERPRHPYSTSLLSAVPHPDPDIERTRGRIVLRGDLPSPLAPPSGCRFRTRCWKAQQICAAEPPPLHDHVAGHAVACHFPEGT